MTPLSEAVAVRVRELRNGQVMHTWRRIAEIICLEFPEQPIADGFDSPEAISGNQLYGQDLCRRAGLED